MSDLEIILSTVGTDGDANPFIALGKELAKRRYTVSIMTNADHEACAIGNDIGFFAMNEPDWPQINRNDSIFFRELISYGYPRAYMAIKAKLEQGKKLFLINRNGNWGTLFCAERFKIPLVRVALQPCAILEEGSPVPPMNRILVNKFRRNIGLSPLLRRS